MTTAEVFAPAKINLTLHVTGQREDGYHLLDSLVVFADIGDRLWFSPGPELSLAVIGPFSAGVPTDARNLVWRAAEVAGLSGSIRLQKNLPHGAGLGGGSADAAALLRSQLGDDVDRKIGPKAALSLGADVPVCLHTGPQRMQGIGERLTRHGPVPDLAVVLVNPGVHIPTQDVFRALACKENPEMAEVSATGDFDTFIAWLSRQRNDLQDAATRAEPVIAEVIDALSDAELARMSGSGATCFGIYRSDPAARDAAARIALAHPQWWVVSGRTLGGGSD